MQRRYALPLIGMAGRALSFELGRWRLAAELLQHGAVRHSDWHRCWLCW
jgi:hypothetical protein